MSVCFTLYKVNDNVDYIGNYLDILVRADLSNNDNKALEVEIEHGAPIDKDGNITDYDAYYAWSDEQKKKAWSDNQEHEQFDLKYHKQLYKGTKSLSRLKEITKKHKIKVFPSNEKGGTKYLTLDEQCYRQGWFLKKKFFKKKVTSVICITRRQMNQFFEQYLDFNSPDALELYDTFNKVWDNEFIFECSW